MSKRFRVHREDIPIQLAYDAHRGTSMTSNVRAKQVCEEYVRVWQIWIEEFARYGDDDAMWKALRQFNSQYIERFKKVLSVKGRCISSMITGPSNFPTRKAQKANDREAQVTGDFIKWYNHQLKRLRGRWDPEQVDSAPVRVGDEDAVERLTEQLEKRLAKQDHMKAVNKILRRKIPVAEKMQQLAGIGVYISDWTGLPSLTYAPYQLSNNSANIRRLRQRLQDVQREAARRQQPVEDVIADGVRMHENYDLDRLQLIFDRKPPAETRRWLSAHGFHWSRKEVAWQRQLTDNARAAGKAFMEMVIVKDTKTNS